MKKIAIIDFDGTLINGQSQKYLIKYFLQKRKISFLRYFLIIAWYFGYKIGVLKDVSGIMRYGIKYLENKTVSSLNEIFDNFLSEVCLDKLYPDSLGLINYLKENGVYTILLSNAIHPIIERIAAYLKVDEYFSTKLEIIDGVYTGRIVNKPLYGKEKVSMLSQYLHDNDINKNEVLIFADHTSDIPLLLYNDSSYVVNPGYKMKKFAEKNKLPVLYLNRNESFQYFKSHTLS